MSIKQFGIIRDIPEPEMPDLVFFDTRKQQTRLVKKGNELTIELENKETDDVKRYPVKGSGIHVNPDYKERTGLVDIGECENWLYSKRLFLDEHDLERQIRIRLEGDIKYK